MYLELIALDEEGGGRRASRTRKQVNYALPNLRDKMRREDNRTKKGEGEVRVWIEVLLLIKEWYGL